MREDFIDSDEEYNPYMTSRFLFSGDGLNEKQRYAKLEEYVEKGIIKPVPESFGFRGKDIITYLKRKERKREEVRKKQVKEVLEKLNELLNGQVELKKNVAELSKEVEKIKRLQVDSESWKQQKTG